jgi:hypothetical protein
MHDSKFITDDDLEYFSKNDINYSVDMPIFLHEIRAYFNVVWQDKFFIKDDIASIEELNSRYLENYPSTGGYYILEDSFTSGHTEILSENSRFILGHLYNIHLR